MEMEVDQNKKTSFRYFMVFEYNGTAYCGYQFQPNKSTVQGEVEECLSNIIGKTIKIYASGRTDAGVHAMGQIAHFDLESEVKENFLHHEINRLLPDDIRVLKLQRCNENFDVRFCSKKKTYIYKFYLSRYERPLYKNLALRVNDNVDIEKMKDACSEFIGTNDYSSFVARKCGKTNFVRTVYDAKIYQLDDETSLYAFEITGNGFLYNMVRIIFGTLLDVGYGRKKKKEIKAIVENKDRKFAGKTMPPYGLYLKKVEYNVVI